jgi:hypothetical protein
MSIFRTPNTRHEMVLSMSIFYSEYHDALPGQCEYTHCRIYSTWRSEIRDDYNTAEIMGVPTKSKVFRIPSNSVDRDSILFISKGYSLDNLRDIQV